MKDGPAEALERNRNYCSTNLRLRAEGGGRLIAEVLTGGDHRKQLASPALLAKGAVPRRGRGQPRLRPQRMVGDKGYSGLPTRDCLRHRGFRPMIPT